MSRRMESSVGDLKAGHDYLNAHLTLENPPNGSAYGAEPERREAHCCICGCRVTVGETGIEYGHAMSCEHHCHGGRE